MTYSEEEYLNISGLQHFIFCRRQWALIHIENMWAENYRTADGRALHKRAHDGGNESRAELLIYRSLRVSSPGLGIAGECDVVEFYRSREGVPLQGHSGTWQAYPVEYKRGRPKEDLSDTLQLCAQAMCLEEMLSQTIPEGALYYGEERHRTRVVFTDELREQVKSAVREMHELYSKGHTPRAKQKKCCNACSLKELCLPKLCGLPSARLYIKKSMEEPL